MSYSPTIKRTYWLWVIAQALVFGLLVLRPGVRLSIPVSLLVSGALFLPWVLLIQFFLRSSIRIEQSGEIWVQNMGRTIRLGQIGEVKLAPSAWGKWVPLAVAPGTRVHLWALIKTPLFVTDGRDEFLSELLGCPPPEQ